MFDFSRDIADMVHGESCLLYGGIDYLEGAEEKLKEAGVEVSCVEQFGGEGKGEDIWAVYSVRQNGIEELWKAWGFYASYHGADFEGIVRVERKQVTRTEYVEVSDSATSG